MSTHTRETLPPWDLPAVLRRASRTMRDWHEFWPDSTAAEDDIDTLDSLADRIEADAKALANWQDSGPERALLDYCRTGAGPCRPLSEALARIRAGGTGWVQAAYDGLVADRDAAEREVSDVAVFRALAAEAHQHTDCHKPTCRTCLSIVMRLGMRHSVSAATTTHTEDNDD